jgi:hypothetical protein
MKEDKRGRRRAKGDEGERGEGWIGKREKGKGEREERKRKRERKRDKGKREEGKGKCKREKGKGKREQGEKGGPVTKHVVSPSHSLHPGRHIIKKIGVKIFYGVAVLEPTLHEHSPLPFTHSALRFLTSFASSILPFLLPLPFLTSSSLPAPFLTSPSSLPQPSDPSPPIPPLHYLSVSSFLLASFHT